MHFFRASVEPTMQSLQTCSGKSTAIMRALSGKMTDFYLCTLFLYSLPPSLTCSPSRIFATNSKAIWHLLCYLLLAGTYTIYVFWFCNNSLPLVAFGWYWKFSSHHLTQQWLLFSAFIFGWILLTCILFHYSFVLGFSTRCSLATRNILTTSDCWVHSCCCGIAFAWDLTSCQDLTKLPCRQRPWCWRYCKSCLTIN